MQQQEAPPPQYAPPPAPEARACCGRLRPPQRQRLLRKAGRISRRNWSNSREMHNAGVLSDQEFEEAKQKALASG